MINSYFLKHPDAVVPYEFIFSDDIPASDFIGDYALTILDSDGVDVTEDVLLSASIDTDKITANFTGGHDGQNYLITVRVSLDLSVATPVRIVEMRVRTKAVA